MESHLFEQAKNEDSSKSKSKSVWKKEPPREKVLGGESGTKQKVLALTFNTKPRANARLDLC